jgi:hypothetical protein
MRLALTTTTTGTPRWKSPNIPNFGPDDIDALLHICEAKPKRLIDGMSGRNCWQSPTNTTGWRTASRAPA